MGWLRRIPFLLGTLLQRRRFESEMDDELRFHVEMQTDSNMRAGLSPDEARRAALCHFGGFEQVKEVCRDARGWTWLDSLWKDLRFAGRIFVRDRGFTFVIVFTLALGIGANTAIFSVINAVLLRPLPYEDPERLVMLWESNPEAGFEQEQASGGNLTDWQQQSESFESIGYLSNHGPWSRNFLLELEDQPVRLRARYASASFFDVFGVEPLLGRTFLPEEEEPDGELVAVLSSSFWQRQFGGDPEALGKTINVRTVQGARQTYTIVGIMPPSFKVPPDAEAWFSWPSDAVRRRSMAARGTHSLWAFARLKPGVTAEQARAELNVIQSRIAAEHADVARIGTQVRVIPLLDQVIGPSTRPALLLLLGAVAFVLLIACANVANLLLARAGARQKEIAIRVALGAGRLRVVRQLLTESVLLALCGGTIGIVLCVWAIKALGGLSPDNTFRSVREFRIDRIADMGLDMQVLAFTFIVSICTGVLFGLVPALHTVKIDVNQFLKEEGRSASAGAARQRLHNLLLVSQVALALILLVSAGLMMQSFLHMQQIDPGVQAQGVVKFEVDLDMATRKYPGEIRDVTLQLMERIRAMPAVVAVGSAGEMPLIKSGWHEALIIEGRPVSGPSELPEVDLRIVSPELFRALGTPLLQGRDLSEFDAEGAPRTCLVNKEFQRRFFPDESPLGNRISLRVPGDWLEIVGVVGNTRSIARDAEVRPEVYGSYRQHYWGGAELGPTFVVRTAHDPMGTLALIRHEIEGPNGTIPIIGKVQTLDDVLGSSVADERLRTTLVAVFAAAALLLAMIGIYGVMSWTVTQRTHEIGIRMALGADPALVLRMVLGRGLKLTLCGVAIGIIGSFGATRLLASQLYGITALEPIAYIAVPILLIMVALVACYFPARRATKIDPAVALRHE